MNKIKQFYSSPTAELLVVRFEGGFLTGSPFGEKGAAGGIMTVNDHGEDDDSLY